MQNARKAVARNLRRIRHERGLSQENLADRAGADRSNIGLLERLGKALAVEAAAAFLAPQRKPR